VSHLRAILNRRRYRVLDEQQLRRSRKSDTVFVFGSGYSLHDLGTPEWDWIERHDTLGFNWFVRQDWVRVDYQLIREVAEDDFDAEVWRPQVAEYSDRIATSRHYSNAIFLVQSGLRALNANRLIGDRLLPQGSPIFLWRSIPGRKKLGASLAAGLSHPFSTLDEAVNFAALLGWTEIVLVGVDLYDRRYFWLGPAETRAADLRRGARYDERHNVASDAMLENVGEWAAVLQTAGTRLSVYNHRSLLARVLPVYSGGADASVDRA
jgi:hypothetical protein